MIQNLLTVDEQSANDAALWYASQNCTIVRSAEKYRDAPASIKMTPVTVGGSDMEVTLVRAFNVTPNTKYRCFAYFFENNNGGKTVSVRPKLFDATGSEITFTASGSAVTKFNTWTLVASEFTTPANTVTARIVVSADADNEIYFEQVGFVTWPDELTNRFMNLAKRWIPSYMKEADDELSDPTIPLTRFMDLVTMRADNILTSTLNFDYIPETDGVVGYERSSLVDPEYYVQDYVAEADWLPWLSQLVGVTPLVSSSGGSLTPWFWFESEYPTWNDWQVNIDTAANPVFPITSISRDANGVISAVLGAQSAGDPFVPSEFYAIEVLGTTDFDGAFVVDSVTGTGPYTLEWYNSGSVTSETPTATVTFTDASWTEVEDNNPQAFRSVDVLKHLTRTGATGINAGSRVSMVAAARAVLEGVDIPATVSRSGNVVTVTTDAPHGLFASDYVAIYSASNRTLNSDDLTVASVVSPHIFTIAQNGYDISSADCWVTNKLVTVTSGSTQWDLTMETLEDQTYAVDLLYQAVNKAKPAGLTVTYGYTTP